MVRRVPALAGLVGGLAWIVAALVGSGTPADVLVWAGAVLLAVAALAAGAGLVGAATWLRVIVAVGFLLLSASVVAVLLDSAGDRGVHAVLGALAALAAVLVLGRLRTAGDDAPGNAPRARRSGGSHSR